MRVCIIRPSIDHNGEVLAMYHLCGANIRTGANGIHLLQERCLVQQ